MLEEFISMPAPAVQAGGIMQPIDACNRWALGVRWACAGSRQGRLAPGTAEAVGMVQPLVACSRRALGIS